MFIYEDGSNNKPISHFLVKLRFTIEYSQNEIVEEKTCDFITLDQYNNPTFLTGGTHLKYDFSSIVSKLCLPLNPVFGNKVRKCLEFHIQNVCYG